METSPQSIAVPPADLASLATTPEPTVPQPTTVLLAEPPADSVDADGPALTALANAVATQSRSIPKTKKQPAAPIDKPILAIYVVFAVFVLLASAAYYAYTKTA